MEIETKKLPPDTQLVAPDLRNTRARVSNGSKLTIFGDGRSAGARRYRDLVRAFGDEAGGFAGLPETGKQIVRRLAQTSVELELLEAQRSAGQAIDHVTYCVLVNTQRRALRDLEKIKAAVVPNKPKPGSALREYLAQKAAEKAAAEGQAA